jgi:prepilin-type N-terminal cleavage/methylation domain-containing protein
MRSRKGVSLVELVIVVLILGALAAIAIPRIMTGAGASRNAACDTNVGIINMQMELYNASENDYPDLVDLFADPNYFPDGTPVCPYDATAYALDSNDRCVDHAHE